MNKIGNVYSDQYIDQLINEQKVTSPVLLVWQLAIQPKFKLSHKEYNIDVDGVNGSKFRIIFRQNVHNLLDFSVIIGHCSLNMDKIFRLRRYNGNSHEHTNSLEGNSFRAFHIHKATERYQFAGNAEDTYAEPTDRFCDFRSAFKCLLNDCNFVP